MGRVFRPFLALAVLGSLGLGVLAQPSQQESQVVLKFHIEPPEARDALIYFGGSPEDTAQAKAVNDENSDGKGDTDTVVVDAKKYPEGRVTFSVRKKGFADYDGSIVKPNAFLNPSSTPVEVDIQLKRKAINYLALGFASGGLLMLMGGVFVFRSRRRRQQTELQRWLQDHNLKSTDANSPEGKLFGEYWLIEKLGQGGMATVYKALRDDQSEDQWAAVKIVHPHLVGGKDFQTRFRREVEVGTKLIHPNIITVLSAGEKDGDYYLALEYVEGSELRSRIPEDGFDLKTGLEYLLPIFGAVSYAHKMGVVHRDIKPENVLIKADGTLKLSDFGLARSHDFSTVTATGAALGTPAYMAPEQIQGQPIDPACDQYALGVMTFQLLTGHLPFEDDEVMQLILKHLTAEPPKLSSVKPGLPEALDRIVARMLRKAPADRYPSVQEAALELSSLKSTIE